VVVGYVGQLLSLTRRAVWKSDPRH